MITYKNTLKINFTLEKILKNQVYSYADVGYYGLTHSLLAWARCELWSSDNNVPMLSPNWLRIRGRLGPLIRNEFDKRQYQKLFQFSDYITGLQRIYLLNTLQPVNVDDYDELKREIYKKRILVLFKNKESFNSETYFHKIIGRNAEVRNALLKITRPQFRPTSFINPHIAIHIRMGDFLLEGSAKELKNGQRNTRLPLVWYDQMLRGVKKIMGDIPAVIYSDGSDFDLRPILSLKGVARAPKKSAITDLLAISQSNLLISSGSGFSQWGSYLGNVPRICYPGQRFIRVLQQGDFLDLEPECENISELPENFITLISKRLL